MNRQRQVIRVVAIAVALFVIGACGGSSGDQSNGSVTIYSGRTQNLIEPILNRFAEETGIDVKVRYGQSADLALLIDEEGGQTPADLFISQSPGSVGYLDAKGRLGKLPDSVLDLVPEGLHAGDGSWVGLSGRKRVLAFNSKLDESKLPTTVFDLTKSEWKGRIGVAPSNASFQDFVTAMRNAKGDEATKQWLQGIAANDAFIYANNNAIVAAIDRGEIDVGLVNHYYVFQALAENPSFKAKNHDFAPDDLGSLLIVSAAAVIRESKHGDEAAQLARFLLNEEAQRYFSDQTYEYPLAAGVKPTSGLPPIDFRAAEGIDFDRLGGDLESTRKMIRDVGLES
jgi:iron(III) transport system substrate-binding protein